jgi:hypothetical protein
MLHFSQNYNFYKVFTKGTKNNTIRLKKKSGRSVNCAFLLRKSPSVLLSKNRAEIRFAPVFQKVVASTTITNKSARLLFQSKVIMHFFVGVGVSVSLILLLSVS